MTEVTAKLRYIRMSPRKTRLVAAVVRGLSVSQAEAQLQVLRVKAAPVILKLIRSAVASAEHNFKLQPDNLYIKSISIDGGPVLKRYKPRAFGRASSIRKPTSHINIVLAEIEVTSSKVKKQETSDKDVKSDKSGTKKVDIKDKAVKQLFKPNKNGKGKQTKVSKQLSADKSLKRSRQKK